VIRCLGIELAPPRTRWGTLDSFDQPAIDIDAERPG
jgi:hypothetical protein